MTIQQEVIKCSAKGTYFSVEICGSFRRGANTCGDIDVLLQHSEYDSKCDKKNSYLSTFVDKLTENGFITDCLSQGDAKFMVRILNSHFYVLNSITIYLPS